MKEKNPSPRCSVKRRYMYLRKPLVEEAPVDGDEREGRGGELGGAAVVQKQRDVPCVSLSASILKRDGCFGERHR